MKQKTLKNSFSVSGKGLHTGLNITATFLPAPENHGYKIQRVDLEGQPVIEALAENVVETSRGTVIADGDVRISTIEHAMAALYAAEIDNCLIQVNAPEMPILDGSAAVYAEEIERCGLEEQNAEREYYLIKSKIEIHDEETGSSIVVLPDDEFSIDTLISFDSPILNNQFASLDDLHDFKTGNELGDLPGKADLRRLGHVDERYFVYQVGQPLAFFLPREVDAPQGVFQRFFAHVYFCGERLFVQEHMEL